MLDIKLRGALAPHVGLKGAFAPHVGDEGDLVLNDENVGTLAPYVELGEA